MKKTNKILAFGIVLCMLFSFAIVPAGAEVIDSGECGDDLTWTLDSEGTLTISGTGDMQAYAGYSDVPWYSLRSSIQTVTIETGVTSISAYAFYDCNSLTSVTIADSVINIGICAFYDCIGITSITIPDSVENIGSDAFYGCSSITSVNITDLAAWCDIYFGLYTSNPLYYAHNLYLNGQLLTDIEVPYGVTALKRCVFNRCNITSVTIPDSVTSIGKDAFGYCSNLTSISIPDNVTSIEGYAFQYCSSLTSINIPHGVTSIQRKTFSECSSLTDVYYGGGKEDWNDITISMDNSCLTNAKRHYYYTYELTEPLDYAGKTHYLPKGCTLITTDDLYFRNGYIQSEGGIIKAGDREITGERIYFTNDGKMHLDADYTAKVERDNGDGTTSQGFMVGMNKPSGIITINLWLFGTANDVDYTGRTISKEFDFTNYDINGLVNFGFTVNNIPKPLRLSIKSIE